MDHAELLEAVFTADCPDESNHTWERLSDGTYLCVWCYAKIKRVGL